MKCPGCGHQNKPGLEYCAICTAPLYKIQLLKNVPSNVLLKTSSSGRLYFCIALLIIAVFASYLLKIIYSFQKALQDEDNSCIAFQIMQTKARLHQLKDY